MDFYFSIAQSCSYIGTVRWKNQIAQNGSKVVRVQYKLWCLTKVEVIKGISLLLLDVASPKHPRIAMTNSHLEHCSPQQTAFKCPINKQSSYDTICTQTRIYNYICTICLVCHTFLFYLFFSSWFVCAN